MKNLNIVFCRINQTGSQCIFRSLVNVVYAQLAEYVLAVGIDRMEAGKALLGYFFRRHSQRYVFQNLSLSLGEVNLLLLLLFRSQKYLHHALADKTVACHTETYRFLDFH